MNTRDRIAEDVMNQQKDSAPLANEIREGVYEKLIQAFIHGLEKKGYTREEISQNMNRWYKEWINS